MNGAWMPDEPPLDPAELVQEHRVLQEFLHLAPVGLMRLKLDGSITVMNPMAAQLLAPVGLDRGDFNLFKVLEPLSADIALLLQTFHDTVGVICENFRVLLPVMLDVEDPPLALGITLLRVSSPTDPYMVVVTDQTQAVKLQRLQGSWIR